MPCEFSKAALMSMMIIMMLMMTMIERFLDGETKMMETVKLSLVFIRSESIPISSRLISVFLPLTQNNSVLEKVPS